MYGCQTDRRVHTDLPEALVHGAHHSVQNDERGDHQGHYQSADPLHTGHTDGAVGEGAHLAVLIGHADEQSEGGARQIALDDLLGVDVLVEPDGDRHQPRPHALEAVIRQDRQAARRQVLVAQVDVGIEIHVAHEQELIHTGQQELLELLLGRRHRLVVQIPGALELL